MRRVNNRKGTKARKTNRRKPFMDCVPSTSAYAYHYGL